MEVILYIAAIIAAIGFLIFCVSVGMTLFSLKPILNSLAGTLSGIEGQMEGITRETTSLLSKTNSLAEDIQEKSEQLNSVVHAVKGIGDSVNGLNKSVQQITSSISTSVEQNEEKIAQVVQWSNVAIGIADKWKKRKIIEQANEVIQDDVYPFESAQTEKSKRKWGRKK